MKKTFGQIHLEKFIKLVKHNVTLEDVKRSISFYIYFNSFDMDWLEGIPYSTSNLYKDLKKVIKENIYKENSIYEICINHTPSFQGYAKGIYSITFARMNMKCVIIIQKIKFYFLFRKNIKTSFWCNLHKDLFMPFMPFIKRVILESNYIRINSDSLILDESDFVSGDYI